MKIIDDKHFWESCEKHGAVRKTSREKVFEKRKCLGKKAQWSRLLWHLYFRLFTAAKAATVEISFKSR